jgi:hypothetical protein
LSIESAILPGAMAALWNGPGTYRVYSNTRVWVEESRKVEMVNSADRATLGDYRRDDEAPAVISKLGWRYHHIGIPTQTPRSNERYIAQYRMYVSGFNSSPYGIEWMRFESGCPLPEIIQTTPHIAFEVDDLEVALKGCEVVFPPSSPSEGVRAAMIIDDGALVELISFGEKEETSER